MRISILNFAGLSPVVCFRVEKFHREWYVKFNRMFAVAGRWIEFFIVEDELYEGLLEYCMKDKKKQVVFMVLKEFESISNDGTVRVRFPGEMYISEDPRIKDLVKRGLVMIDDLQEKK